MITQSELLKVLFYNETTGQFHWIAPTGLGVGWRFPLNHKAGNVGNDKRISIRINGRKYKAHRLAWLYVHGEWPRNEIDHIDGNPGNNRICNLRLATRSENQQNQRRPLSTNPYLGVSWYSREGLWRAVIVLNKKYMHIGCFSDPESARDAYLEAKKKYHPYAPKND